MAKITYNKVSGDQFTEDDILEIKNVVNNNDEYSISENKINSAIIAAYFSGENNVINLGNYPFFIKNLEKKGTTHTRDLIYLVDNSGIFVAQFLNSGASESGVKKYTLQGGGNKYLGLTINIVVDWGKLSDGVQPTQYEDGSYIYRISDTKVDVSRAILWHKINGYTNNLPLYLRRIYRKRAGGGQPNAIIIHDSANNWICNYSENTTIFTGIQLIKVPSYGGLKVSIDLLIDYDALPDVDVVAEFGSTSVIEFTNTDFHPFMAKKYMGWGDSITASYILNQIQERCSFATIVNKGVSGNTIAQMITRLDADILADATIFDTIDMLHVLIGINDYQGNQTLGAISDAVGAASFYGRLKYVIEKILNTKPTQKLFFMTPLEMNDVGHPYKTANTLGFYVKDYRDAVIDVCNYYGVPVLDLLALSGFNNKTISTYTSDGLHPNTIGAYRIAELIKEFIKQFN